MRTRSICDGTRVHFGEIVTIEERRGPHLRFVFTKTHSLSEKRTVSL